MSHTRHPQPAASVERQNGSIIVVILIIMLFLTTMLFGAIVLAKANIYRAWSRLMLLQAQYSAESGADYAITTLNNVNGNYSGTASDQQVLTNAFYKATFSVTVAAGSNSKEKLITAVGKVYRPATAITPTYTRTIRVTTQRTATTTASSILSRNILDIASGVKNIYGGDMYINGYINMAKSTTNLIAENITVAGKNTGASNCSIGGSGNLVKPSTFTVHPSQTKTNLTLAFNNCVTPPGNTSNSNFNVLANQTNVTTVQSISVPWSQYMDSTYQNAGNCNDWTTGTSPRSIPSVAGSKKTHYPDSGSGISTTCGSSGDLLLGSNQYNITDNVHIRANLCKTSACSPTFYNPTANTYFIFVEGSVDFGSLQTASGSGPIVLVVYGSDPGLFGGCPDGDALYLGNSGTSSAKAIFLLATNGGVCIDKTKFASSPALGGLGGKNIYVGSNPGTPFDLQLDTSFPVSQIPTDLAWRATGYERL